MSDQNGGFTIDRLIVSGRGQADAQLSFTDGLNVVTGASDTGKSFALSCMDFAFGARKAPRKIKEVKGYSTVSLYLTNRVTRSLSLTKRLKKPS